MKTSLAVQTNELGSPSSLKPLTRLPGSSNGRVPASSPMHSAEPLAGSIAPNSVPPGVSGSASVGSGLLHERANRASPPVMIQLPSNLGFTNFNNLCTSHLQSGVLKGLLRQPNCVFRKRSGFADRPHDRGAIVGEPMLGPPIRGHCSGCGPTLLSRSWSSASAPGSCRVTMATVTTLVGGDHDSVPRANARAERSRPSGQKRPPLRRRTSTDPCSSGAVWPE